MSFMFHPYPYKDLNAVNAVAPRDTVVEGALPVARRIAALFGEGCRTVGLDGYAGTEFDVLYQLLAAQLQPRGVRIVRTEALLPPPGNAPGAAPGFPARGPQPGPGAPLRRARPPAV